MDKYSLWIIPDKKVGKALQRTITDLSKKHHGPDFEPHMTLLGDIHQEKDVIIKKAQILAHDLHPFTLTLSEISFSTTYFQSVFVRMKSTASLMNANLAAKKIYGVDNNVFMPHMSLIYGEHAMEEREKIASEIALPSNLSFIAKKIIVVPSTPHPKDWVHIVEIPIK